MHGIAALLLFAQLTLAALPYLGHDISSLLALESGRTTYEGLNGAVTPLEQILKAGNMNTVRMRVWVNPAGGTYGLPYNVRLATRMKQAGMKIYLDLHYSDSWADPGKQNPPAAWPRDLDGLLQTINTYTQNVVSTFSSNDIVIDIISIGNEIRSGLLWPLGKTPNYDNIARLLKQAVNGVKAGNQKQTPKIMIHIDDGYSWDQQSSFYDNVLRSGSLTLSDFDIQGVSFYPFYGTSATLANLQSATTQMANKYHKDIIIAETDWPDKCSGGPALSERNIPVNATGQLQWVQAIAKVVNAIPGGRGKGIFYWEPAWLNNTNLGSGCSDVILFDRIQGSSPVGKARPSVNMFNGL